MPETGPLRRLNGSSPEEAEPDEDGATGPESTAAAFRISVDLSEYFQEHASCYLWVPRPRETRTVRWLARRLRQTAALRERFCLVCDTHTLPPDEPLQLLRPGDALRVVRVEHEWQRVFSFRGERAPPASPPKTKKRCRIHTAPTEPPTLAPVPQSNPTQELASLPQSKSTRELASVPQSKPTWAAHSVVGVEHEWRVYNGRGEFVPPVTPPKTKKGRKIDTAPTEPPKLAPVPQSNPTQELASTPQSKSTRELASVPQSKPIRAAHSAVGVEHDWQRVFSFRGERALPAPAPKTKKRYKTDTAPTEPPTLASVPQSKSTRELASVPQSKPTRAAHSVVGVEHDWQRVFSFRGEFVPPATPPKTKKGRKIDTAPTEPHTLASVPQSKPTQELASLPQSKPTQELASVPQSKSTRELASVPQSKPTLAAHSVVGVEHEWQRVLPPTTSPSVLVPSSVQPTTPVLITESPSQDEELQRFKRRALALLQRVEGEFSRGQEREREDEEDETDGVGNEWPPAKKRRRRVRRRRALPPVDFEQELILSTTKSSNPVETTTQEVSMTPVPTTVETTVLEPYSIPAPLPSQPPTPASPALPTQPSILASPSIPMLSLSLAPTPGPVVLRVETTQRLPRLIRALDATRSEDISQAVLQSQEHNASTAPAPLPQTAVQCS